MNNSPAINLPYDKHTIINLPGTKKYVYVDCYVATQLMSE